MSKNASKPDQAPKVSEKGVHLDQSAEYVAFPLRETALALRVLGDEGPSKNDNAGKTMAVRSQSLISRLKDTFFALNRHYSEEILSIPKNEKDAPQNAEKLADADSILACGIALHLPLLNGVLLVVGKLYDPTSDKPFGTWDFNLMDSGLIRYWILDMHALCNSASTSSVVDKDNLLNATEKAPGICRIILRKTEAISKETLRQCDHTFGLSKLIPLDRPWFQNYLPAFQVYHEQLDAMSKAQSELEPEKTLPAQPQVEHAFCAQGATAADLLVLPSPMEFLTTCLVLLKNDAFRKILGEPPVPDYFGPTELDYRFSPQTKDDFNDSLARIAFFLNTRPSDMETHQFKRQAFLSKGATVKLKESTPDGPHAELLLKPNDITSGIGESLAYGLGCADKDNAAEEVSLLRSGHLLDLRQACTLPNEVVKNLSEQIELRRAFMRQEMPVDEFHKQSNRLVAQQDRLHLKHFKGHLLWGKVRTLIDNKLMSAQDELNDAISPFDSEVVAITQRLNQRGHLRSMVGFSVNLFTTPFEDAPFLWADPFYHAPARSCFRVTATASEMSTNTVLNGLGLYTIPLTFLVNRDDKKKPMEGAFPENTAYNPAALYVDMDAAKAANRELEDVMGCDTDMIAYGANLARKEEWFNFLQYPTLLAQATLDDQSLSLIKSEHFRHDLFGVKI